jgi:dihydrofolate reductase
MRKLILLMQLSLDGFIEGPNGAMDWITCDDEEAWSDLFSLLESPDTFLLGRKMWHQVA